MLRVAVIVALVSLVSSATIGVNKKDGYGGSSYGSSYDASAYSAAAPATNDASYGSNSAATSYGGANSAPSYSSAAGSPSYGTGTQTGYGASPSSDSSSDSYGNLYYYYYPVTNHSGPSSYANNGGGGGGNYGQGGNSYGGGSPNYYPPAPVGPPPFSDPLGGLLSVIGTIDINSLILPALLIAGVALVLPAILNCDLELGTCIIPLPFSNQAAAQGRSRREAEMLSLQQITIPQMIDHAYNIYDAVYESEQCMERVVCELGGMMRNIRGKETFFSVLEHVASPTIKKQLKVLKEGALPSIEETTSCDKFMCGRLDNKVD